MFDRISEGFLIRSQRVKWVILIAAEDLEVQV